MLTGIENDPDIQSLDSDIERLQKINIQKEAEVGHIRTKVMDIEKEKLANEAETEGLAEKNREALSCLSELKLSLIESLQNIRLPNCDDKLSDDNFDTYIGRLQQLYEDKTSPDNRLLFCAIKQALATVKTVELLE